MGLLKIPAWFQKKKKREKKKVATVWKMMSTETENNDLEIILNICLIEKIMSKWF